MRLVTDSPKAVRMAEAEVMATTINQTLGMALTEVVTEDELRASKRE